ncbi:MAG: hypothetical protein ACK4Q5_08380 [Saprospiraceae bacterium]
MKNILAFALALVCSLSFATANTASNPINPAAEFAAPTKKVTLSAGTLVILESNESLFSGAVAPGKMIQMRVRTNVFAEGKLVIRTGATALGRVKSIEGTTFNAPESVTIELFYVQAVDGQQIPLNGNEQTITGTAPNEGTTVPVNTLITSQTMNDQEIKVD